MSRSNSEDNNNNKVDDYHPPIDVNESLSVASSVTDRPPSDDGVFDDRVTPEPEEDDESSLEGNDIVENGNHDGTRPQVGKKSRRRLGKARRPLSPKEIDAENLPPRVKVSPLQSGAVQIFPEYDDAYNADDSENDAEHIQRMNPVEDEQRESWVVRHLEYYLRLVCLFVVFFLLGVNYPELAPSGQKVLEYCAVAWGTCVTILLVSFCNKRMDRQRAHEGGHLCPSCERRRSRSHSNFSQKSFRRLGMIDEATPLLKHRRENGGEADLEAALTITNGARQMEYGHAVEKSQALFVHEEDDLVSDDGVNDSVNRVADTPIPVTRAAAENARSTSGACLSHPSLEPFYVIDAVTKKRIVPNELDTRYKIDTDYFSGEMMILVRTPDVDDVTNTETLSVASKYFRGKKRRFEFQFQVRLKKVPRGRVYFCCELEEPVKMGVS